MQNRVDKIENILKDEEMEILFARVASNILQKGSVNEAIKICEDGLKKYPAYAQAHFVLAQCYSQIGKVEEARAEYERVLRYDPNHLNAIKQLSEIYKSSGLEDVYKEFVMKRFILDPLNDEVIEIVKQLGLYEAKDIEIEHPLQEESIEPFEQEMKEIEESKSSDLEEMDLDEDSGKEEKLEKLDLSLFDNRDSDFSTILEAGTQSEQGYAFDEDSTITLDGFPEKPTEGKKSEEQITPEERKVPSEKGQQEKTEEGDEQADLSDDTVEDFDELDFEAESGELLDEGDSKEKFGGMNDTTQILLDPKATPVIDDKLKPSEEISEQAEETGKDDKERDSESDDSSFKESKIISQTLGEILVSQKKYSEALEVFKTLKNQQPDNQNVQKKITLLEQIISLEQK